MGAGSCPRLPKRSSRLEPPPTLSRSELLEGSAGQVTVVLRFATKAAAQAWYDSPEYRAIRHLRTDNTEGTGAIAEGR